MTADERLIAYLDGELTEAERAAFEADLAADPALAAEVRRHKGLAARVVATYAPVLREPIPPRLTVLASAANDRGPARFGLPQWAAMAACLVVGVLGSRVLWPDSGPLAMRGGALVARGDLANALTTRLASDPGPVRIGLSFRGPDGRYCRTFQSAADRLAGLACRDGDRWVAQATTAWSPQAQQPEYRAAASPMPSSVLAAVDAMAAGGTLDAAQERAARDRGWKPTAP
jgi:hypothetical protein